MQDKNLFKKCFYESMKLMHYVQLLKYYEDLILNF